MTNATLNRISAGATVLVLAMLALATVLAAFNTSCITNADKVAYQIQQYKQGKIAADQIDRYTYTDGSCSVTYEDGSGIVRVGSIEFVKAAD